MDDSAPRLYIVFRSPAHLRHQICSTVSHDVVELCGTGEHWGENTGKTKTEAPAQYAQWPHHGSFSMRPSSRLFHLVSFPSCSPPFCVLPRPLLLVHRPLLHHRRAPSAFRLPPAIACVLDFGDPGPLWRLNDLLLKEAPPQGGGRLLACPASVDRLHAGQSALRVASTVHGCNANHFGLGASTASQRRLPLDVLGGGRL
jgi:hypothetical protein